MNEQLPMRNALAHEWTSPLQGSVCEFGRGNAACGDAACINEPLIAFRQRVDLVGCVPARGAGPFLFNASLDPEQLLTGAGGYQPSLFSPQSRQMRWYSILAGCPNSRSTAWRTDNR